MSEVLKKYRELKSSNPFAAAQFRRLNAYELRAAEEAERPEEHAAEISHRAKQAAAVTRERTSAPSSIDESQTAAARVGAPKGT